MEISWRLKRARAQVAAVAWSSTEFAMIATMKVRMIERPQISVD